MKISEHVSWKEATFSNTAMRMNISNEPSLNQLSNMQILAEKIFEPLRSWVGNPIKINSFFRSIELNRAIGGSMSSQHCALNGAAIDIDDNYGGRNNKEMFAWISEHLDYDQLIAEFPDETGNPSWIHISYNKGKNRKQRLTAIKENGKTKYVPFFP